MPRKQAEHLEMTDALSGRQDVADRPVVVKLGTWLDNTRKRAEQRHTDLRQQASKEAGQEERCVSAVSPTLRLVGAS
ncbi:hypothetical protein ACFRQM_32745 [Streptomyces sp. NPDC056831]|uniref:hypothetical protein n=1 Tax=Streptomyces sp. NPDC056831 TaxID=3345954 RepID=UPI0036CE2EF4